MVLVLWRDGVMVGVVALVMAGVAARWSYRWSYGARVMGQHGYGTRVVARWSYRLSYKEARALIVAR